MTKKRVFISFGEKSAENHSLSIIKKLSADYSFETLSGSSSLSETGISSLYSLDETSVMGFYEVIRKYPKLRRILKQTCSHISGSRPDLLVLVDYPGFNIPLAAYAKSIGIRTLYYIAPKTWAWGEWRIPKLRKAVDKLAVIFPFEERYFSSFGIETEFVGNPNAENMQPVTNATESGTLGILPGSRKQEILRILPPCIDAARILVDKSVFSRVIVSKSDGIDETILKDMLPADNRFEIINGSRPIFEKSSFLFVKSGTATLEAALAGKPFLSVYKVSAITAMIVRRILKIPNVTMINIMLDSPVVPEILQEKLTSENLVAETLSLVNDNNRLSSMESKFKALAETIANQKPSEKVADIIRKMCNG